MRSSHRSLAATVEFDPEATETRKSRLAATASGALRSKLPILSVAVMGITGMGFMLGGAAGAVPPPTPIGLGAATNTAVEAGQSITNGGTGSTNINGGDASVSPGSSATGFGSCVGGPPCVNFTGGSLHVTDGVANKEVADANTALLHTQSLGGASIPPGLAGAILPAGIYAPGAAILPVGQTLTLDAAGNPNSVWIFNAGAITIGANSTVVFINPGAATNTQLACNVFWTSSSTATIGTGANFVGTLMAQTSITVGDSATVTGRLLSGTASASLLDDTINVPAGCTVVPAGTGGTTGSGGGSSVATGSGGGSSVATGTTAGFAGPATPVAGLPKLTG